jgi:hypothetical protein
MTGGDAENLSDLSTDKRRELMTAAQFISDLCLNEIEHRGELKFVAGVPVVPFESDYHVPTALTR